MKYKFDVSMFERLAESPQLAPVQLNTQARMRPEFAKLLLDVYPGLKTNLPRVARNKVRGL
jgi:hypothetical protein